MGHTADQTHSDCSKLAQGRLAMDAVDSDRCRAVMEEAEAATGQKWQSSWASVSLGSLRPLECTPKNNLLVGVRREHSADSNEAIKINTWLVCATYLLMAVGEEVRSG